MKANWLATLMIIGLIAFTFIVQAGAQEHDHSSMSEHPTSSHTMESGTEKSVSDKARCAYDGMMMKKTAMVPLKHGEETLYFCNEEQKAIFQKAPKRYLKKLAIGNQHILMNTLTMKEYMGMMGSMGMGRMAKKGGASDTHWISAYLVSEHPADLAGIAVKVVSPNGKTAFQELKYDKMMKTYAGNISLLESGKYKVSLLLESSATEMP